MKKFVYTGNRRKKREQKMELENNKITFNITQSAEMQVCYSNLIDFSDKKVILADVTITEHDGNTTPIYIFLVNSTHLPFSANDNTVILTKELTNTSVGNHTLVLDVSEYNGTGYIRLQAQNHDTSNHNNKGYFTKIYYQ